MGYEIQPGEIAIIIKPVEYDGVWDGEINTGLVFGEERLVEAMRESLYIALTMAAAQRFLEESPESKEHFDDIRTELMEDMFPEEYSEALQEYEEELSDMAVEVEGNVYKLNKWTKTDGNA